MRAIECGACQQYTARKCCCLSVQLGDCLLGPATHRGPLGTGCLTFLRRLWDELYLCPCAVYEQLVQWEPVT